MCCYETANSIKGYPSSLLFSIVCQLPLGEVQCKNNKPNAPQCGVTLSIEKLRTHFKRSHPNLSTEQIDKSILHCRYKDLPVEQILYLHETNSVAAISKMLLLSYNDVRAVLVLSGVKPRGISESNKLSSTQTQKRKTYLERYGVDNPSKADSIKQKKAATFMVHYGVENIWKSATYTVWLHQHMLETYGTKALPNRYGGMNLKWKSLSQADRKHWIETATLKAQKASMLWYSALSDEERLVIQTRRAKLLLTSPRVFKSKLEDRISALLTNAGIEHKRQFWIANKSYDIQISGTKTILEVNGDFWHCNPSLYSATATINHGNGVQAVTEIWERDEKKKQLAERYGYTVYYVWESDINQRTDDRVLKDLLPFVTPTTIMTS